MTNKTKERRIKTVWRAAKDCVQKRIKKDIREDCEPSSVRGSSRHSFNSSYC